MARRRSATTIVRAVPVRAPSPIIRISAPSMTKARRAGRAVRRYAGRAASAAAGEKHTIAAMAGAAGLAIAEQHGYKTLMGFPSDAAGGIIAWVAGKYTRSRTAQHVATGLLCVAVHRMMGGETTSGVHGAGRGVVFDDDDDDND